ncbi:hypothetical protein QM565_19330 [Geitlerinema splendidum]|nr:hypothetical protein [Geitlerinema splendidum]
MITQKKQALKRVSYIGLSFFSLMILFDAQADKPTSHYTEEADETPLERRNRIAAKHGLPQRSAPTPYQGPTLLDEAKKFEATVKQKVATIKERNEQEKHLIKGGIKLVIENKVKDEETKSAFFQFLDGFFSE